MTMPKYFRILLFPLAAIGMVLLQNCKCHGPCCDYVPVYYLSTGLYPYLFKTGTFWVYKNQTTGAVDSEYVYTYAHDTSVSGIQGLKDYCGTVAREVWIYRSLSFINGVLIDTSYTGSVAGNAGEYQNIGITNSKANSNGQTIFVLGAPLSVNDQGLYYKGTLSTVNINGGTYYQVQYFYLDISQSTGNLDSANAMFYYAAHVGLIRKTIYTNNNSDSVNWDLINKHNVQ